MSDPIVLVFVHGWNVTDTKTYGKLPEAVVTAAAAEGITIKLRHIYLGRYVSFHDEVTVEDIAIAMDHAVRTDLQDIKAFSCVTHSTGGPVVRSWIDRFYGPKRLNECPLRHLIMLAPANHGSALAVLGKGPLGRMKALLEGIEPGQGVLDWLCLGSPEAWELQQRFTEYKLGNSRFYPFVLSGETIDRKLYDFINSYTAEKGSDGVVRLAAANLNYTFFRLDQSDARYDQPPDAGFKLVLRPRAAPRSPETPFGVIPDASHCGRDIGIMQSVTLKNAASKRVVSEITRCLQVSTPTGYAQRIKELEVLTNDTQAKNAERNDGKKRRFVMFIFRVGDDRGHAVEKFDLVLLGDDCDPDELPKGFFIDRQWNARSKAVVYYLDYDVLTRAEELGIRVDARPVYRVSGGEPDAFSGYRRAEYHLTGDDIEKFIKPNETVYVDIVLKRVVDVETIRFEPLGSAAGSFKRVKPRGPIG